MNRGELFKNLSEHWVDTVYRTGFRKGFCVRYQQRKGYHHIRKYGMIAHSHWAFGLGPPANHLGQSIGLGTENRFFT